MRMRAVLHFSGGLALFVTADLLVTVWWGTTQRSLPPWSPLARLAALSKSREH